MLVLLISFIKNRPQVCSIIHLCLEHHLPIHTSPCPITSFHYKRYLRLSISVSNYVTYLKVIHVKLHLCKSFTSLRHSSGYTPQQTGWPRVDNGLVPNKNGMEPLREPMLTFGQSQLNIICSRKLIWNCILQNGSHFVHTSMLIPQGVSASNLSSAWG